MRAFYETLSEKFVKAIQNIWQFAGHYINFLDIYEQLLKFQFFFICEGVFGHEFWDLWKKLFRLLRFKLEMIEVEEASLL